MTNQAKWQFIGGLLALVLVIAAMCMLFWVTTMPAKADTKTTDPCLLAYQDKSNFSSKECWSEAFGALQYRNAKTTPASDYCLADKLAAYMGYFGSVQDFAAAGEDSSAFTEEDLEKEVAWVLNRATIAANECTGQDRKDMRDMILEITPKVGS